jgi:hypothetical protein
MGQNYQAQKRVEHVAIASEPDMIRPTPNSPPAPFITYAEFDISTGVADQASGNQYPLFTSLSKVPTCKGGPPGGVGKTSGTWNGEFKPTEWSAQVKVDGGWQVYHGHKGTINNGNAKAKVTITVGPGAPSSPCISALQVQFERLKGKAAAEFGADKCGFVKGMGQGAWDNVKGYGGAAGSAGSGTKGGAGGSVGGGAGGNGNGGSGTAGSTSIIWTQTSDSATSGPGGGGGGGARHDSSGAGGNGATGGLYGGGGGGGNIGQGAFAEGVGAAGGQGIIVIEYEPLKARNWGYILN